MLRKVLSVLVVGSSLLACVGCDRGSKLVPIQGAVSLDGQPIREGTIRFQPRDGAGNPSEAIIRDGRYSAEVVAARHAVEIRSPRPAPNAPRRAIEGPGAEGVVMEEAVPARYNANTELTADVTGAATTFDFPLLSAPNGS